ncbi:hypothetical protein Tco_1192450 [Tanacetum coccineum]
MKELQQFQERLKEIIEECNKNIKWIKQVVEKINVQESFSYRRSFQAVFGEEIESFRNGFVNIMAQLEIQLDKEEIHECDSKNRLTWLKEKFEKLFYRKPSKDFLEHDDSIFQSYSGYSIWVFKDRVVCYLQGIEKGIDTRVPHEEVLRIKVKDVNERRQKERHMIEFEKLKLEKMNQKGECNNTGNAQRAKLSQKKCLIHFRLLHTLLDDFSKEDLTNACFSSGFHWAFSSLFGEEVEYFAPRLFFNMDKLEKQLNAEEFNEEIAMIVFKVLKNQL